MPGGNVIIGGGVYRNLKKAVANKSVTEAAVDTMATRFLSAWFKLDQESVIGIFPESKKKKMKSRRDADQMCLAWVVKRELDRIFQRLVAKNNHRDL
jgi:hypothetical protein